MIRIFVLIAALLSLAACADGYQMTPQPLPTTAQQGTLHTTVINETNISSNWSVTYIDGQRAGEHRGQQILACTRMSALREYLDGYRGYLGCQQMFVTTAEEAGYYAGHHIIRFMNQGTFFYGVNDYVPPQVNRSDYCRENYAHEYRRYQECVQLDPFN